MANRVIEAKLLKERRRKRGYPVRNPHSPGRNHIPEKAAPLYEYGKHAKAIGFDEKWNFWFFKIESELEHDKQQAKLLGVAPRYKSVSDEKKATQQRARDLAHARFLIDLEDFATFTKVYSSVTLIPGRKTWTRLFFSGLQYVFVQRVGYVIRKSCIYDKETAYKRFHQGRILWQDIYELDTNSPD